MLKGIALLALVGAGIILSLSTTEAQSSLIAPNQELRYVRQAAENQMEYVGLSATDRFVYSLPQRPTCWTISPSGTYIALSSAENPSSLIVRRIKASGIILQTDWQSNWRPCSIIWLTDTALSLARSDVFNASFRYEISGGTLSPISYTPGQLPALPEFPEQLQQLAIPQFVLRSLQPNVFAYYRCIGQTFPDGYQQCPGGIAVVIYDAANQTFVGELYRPDPYLSGFDVSRERSAGWEKIAWSADGRYLAYASVPNSLINVFDLAIRDLTTNQDLDLDFPNETVEYDVALTWSPVGHKLLFWLWGRLGEGYIGDDDDILRHPIIFDADQQQFVWSENPFEFPPNYFGDPVQWSPDGLAFVFTDTTKNLIHVDALTGTATLLDSNVSTIIDWVEVEQAQPTLPPLTDVQTSTATPPGG
ncbi:MAG: PD40 domain-containing protein [Chloroflexi bacterium]|nr:PD40 domain-containing protein [Chloroflexota bacterium]